MSDPFAATDSHRCSTTKPSQPGRSRRLIVFTRLPETGRVKTRLIPALGPEAATSVHRDMLRHTLGWARLLHHRDVDLEVRVTGSTAPPSASTLLPGLVADVRTQGDGDLGTRLSRAIETAFAEGARQVVVMGTDCPLLTQSQLLAAFTALNRHDIVIGPALDGGYTLLGLTQHTPTLFAGIDWGSERVFAQTLDRAAAAGRSVMVLEPLPDVDRPEDLPAWEHAARRLAPPGLNQTLSVIVPTLNEQAQLPSTLDRLRKHSIELIVADGGSTDQTVAIARSLGARVIRSEPGRAAQMNAGAAIATGELLLFCHADTLLPRGFDQAAWGAIAEPGTVGGAFGFQLAGDNPALRRIERGVAWRCRHRQMPYGDQAIFMRADLFRSLGGFAPLTLMEDVDLVRRLRRRGTVTTVNLTACTSPRAWSRRSVWRTTLANQCALAGYDAGLPTTWLAKLRRFIIG